MILEKKKLDVAINGNFQTKNFTADLTNSKIFEILSSGIYTDPIKAVIREISTNALDSQIAAKVSKPIKVHLPTAFESWFSVRDYGTGIEHEECMNLYSQYGYSTKTESNDFTGALGIGSKSPLSLVDSFVVESFINGVKNTYSIFKNENGIPQIAHLTSNKTDEENGFFVKVEIQKTGSWDNKAWAVFQYWDTFPEINSDHLKELRKNIDSEYVIKRDDFGIINVKNNYGYKSVKAVMGNVAYDIPPELLTGFHYDGYIKFSIGDLDFNTGRESLTNSEQNKSAIKNKLEDVYAELAKELEKDIISLDTPFKRALKLEEIKKSQLNRNSSIFTKLKKYELPECENIQVYSKSSYERLRNLKVKILPLSGRVEYYWEEKTGFITRIREYCKNEAEKTSGTFNLVTLTKEQADKCLIDQSLIKDLSTLPKIEYKKNTGTKQKVVKLFKFEDGGFKPSTIPEDDKSQKLYVPYNRHAIDDYRLNLSNIKSIVNYFKTELNQDLQVYGIKNSFKKLKAFENGNWTPLKQFIKEELTKNKPEVVVIPSYDYNRVIHFFKLISQFVKNNDIHLFCKKANEVDTTLINALNSLSIEYKKDESLKTLKENIFKQYPLLKYLTNSYQSTTDFKKEIKTYLGE